MKIPLFLPAALALTLCAFAPPTLRAAETAVPTSSFRMTMLSRNVQAINYQHRSGGSMLDFVGTDLMPKATGEARVDSKKGYMEIKATFAGLGWPATFGSEYLTYILWAISPEGRAVNLGEVIVDHGNGKLNVTTDLQSFALLVTAEPYYAVRQPSNAVIVENVVRGDTKGTSETVDAHYELLPRGGYLPTGYKFDPVVLNAKLPLEFFEARNALRIARSEGADVYAADSYQRAVEQMDKTDSYAASKHVNRKLLIAAARVAVQTAEDSREIAVKRIGEARLADERRDAANATANAQAQAADATQQKQQAEGDAARARMDAADAQSAAVRAQADAANARAVAEEAKKSAARAEDDKVAMRARLAEQLNAVLQTRETARGLIVSMSDVLFDTGRHTLRAAPREKLAKVAGILLSYPGLNIEVGGHTDNVGGEAMNQRLSESRATSVRDYLVQQGVPSGSITARGYGLSLPVVSNATAAGRQQNRRVELLVSGDAIGKPVVTTGSLH